MKLNEDKCHLMVFGDKSNDVSLNIGRITIKENREEKLLGVILDKRLCFKQQIKSICKKAGQKLHALSRISYFLDIDQLKRIMKAFILSQLIDYTGVVIDIERLPNTPNSSMSGLGLV